MIGLMYLLFFIVYGWISWRVVKAVARRAREGGRSPKLWGGVAGLAMASLVFWDWLPMEVLYRYDCARYAGFTQYQSLEQWKAENPGVAQTLHPPERVESRQEGGRQRYVLNQRFAWDIRYTRHPLHIREREERIVDTRTGKVLARYVDFDTDIGGVSVGSSARGLSDYKIWLMRRSCEADSGRPLERAFYNFKYLVKHQMERK
ncbi:MAG TPA: hypothetical protein ENK05_13490 [Gammaproteobacteria bacterium]|nr:hypothetical protein [Gammaproteobacteria bacterium]